MAKDSERLRKGLASLFQERGDVTETAKSKETFLNGSNATKREQKNTFPKTQGKGPLMNGLNNGKKASDKNSSCPSKKRGKIKKNNDKENSKAKPNQVIKQKKNSKAKPNQVIKQKKHYVLNPMKNDKNEETTPPSLAKKRKLKKSNEPAKKKSKLNENQEIVRKAHVLENQESSFESESYESEYEEYSDSTFDSEYNSDYTFDSQCSSKSEYSDDYDLYSLSSGEEYSCSYQDDSSEIIDDQNSYSDPDYTLPKEAIEDLIIHKGLATTYKLESRHGVVEFNEKTNQSQIIELPDQIPVKRVKQHEAYNIENLQTLEKMFIERKSISNLNDEECPKLVHIEDQDENFKLWTSGITMDDEMFSDDELEEVSDDSSVQSYSDVNRKYTKDTRDSDEFHDYDDDDDDDDDDDGTSNGVQKMKAFIFTDSEKDADRVANPVKNSIFNNEEQQQTSLADVILNASSNIASDASNVKIIKAIIANYDEEEEAINDEETNNISKEHIDRETEVDLSTEIDNDGGDTCMNPSQNLNATQSDAEDIQESEVEIFEEDYTKKQRILTKFYNSIDSYYVLALLKSSIFIYGTVKAQLIAGSTEIYGYKLKKNEMIALHSPRGCSVVPLKPMTSSSTFETILGTQLIADIEALSDEAEFNKRDLRELVDNFDATHDAILLLKRNETSTKIKYIFQKHINENIYPTYIPKSRPFYHTETMLDCMVNGTTAYALQVPQQWHELNLERNSKFMLIGGKSVGKSTLLRYLINKSLKENPCVLLIDLDIGQPEVFVPQTVSCSLIDQPLLGPGFFCQIQSAKAYAVGHTNLILCAHAYMRAVIRLLEFCKNETTYNSVPWILNTMGYNKGFGAELISVICSQLQLTDIIQLQSNNPINNFDILFESSIVGSIKRNIYNQVEFDSSIRTQFNHKLHVIPSAVLQQSRYKQEWQMSAKDMRYIMLLARLSSILPDEGEWINHSEIFKKSLENLHIINLTARDADKIETLKSLECNLVYLCNNTQSAENKEAALECLGIGIVRGIDYHAKQVFIMPAMPVNQLFDVNCLALGEMPLPGSLLTEQNPEAEHNIPYVQVMQDDATSRAVKQFFYRS